MTRVRIDLFASLDGYTSTGQSPENPMGEDRGRLSEAYAVTRTFHERVLGDASGTGTTGVDESYAAAHFEGVGAEIMGAAVFGLHTFPDDPHWRGWWYDQPPFATPVYVLTHTAPRPPIPMKVERPSTSATPPSATSSPRRRRPPTGATCASAAVLTPRATSCAPAWSTTCTS